MSASLRLYGDETVKFTYEGERYCVHVHNDECPDDPRSWDTPFSTMACFHRRYRLGDDVGTSNPEEFWRGLVRKIVPESEVFAAVESGAVTGIRIAENAENKELIDVYETYSWNTPVGSSEPEECLAYEGIRKESLYEYIEDDLTIYNCQQLLEPYLEWLPLWLYDHSGITMSCGARTYPYNDAWDSGCVGWIVAMKDKIIQETAEILRGEDGKPILVEYKHDGGPSTYGVMSRPLTDETWRKRAIEVMEGEVEVYDQYLRGEVYGYTLLKEEDGEWIEQESVWGFYGDDVMENGISDSVPGLAAAVESDQYETGTATRHVAVSYSF